jgi:hypothetical protein
MAGLVIATTQAIVTTELATTAAPAAKLTSEWIPIIFTFLKIYNYL